MKRDKIDKEDKKEPTVLHEEMLALRFASKYVWWQGKVHAQTVKSAFLLSCVRLSVV